MKNNFGLLGRRLSHSLSPQIHSIISAETGAYSYELYEKEPDELVPFLKARSFDGLNVTIPYKKQAAALCDELSPAAQKIGCVNTLIKKEDGSLYGANTDYFGFEYTIRRSGFDPCGKTALVLGTGGASLSVNAVLKDSGCREIIPVSRSGSVNYDNVYNLQNVDFIVNATPVGMFPDNGKKVIDIKAFPSLTAVFDLIYNPSLTPILFDAEENNLIFSNGLPMLAAQAVKSAEIFLGINIENTLIEKIIGIINQKTKNIVLVGMPGCGKSTVAKILSDSTGRELFDTDEVSEELSGKTPREIINSLGEAHFRKIETEAVRLCSKKSGCVIATGGGAPLTAENRRLLRQNSVVIYLKRDLSSLEVTGRPLSEGDGALERLFKAREPSYLSVCDAAVEVHSDADITAKKVLEVFMNEASRH